MKTEKVSRKAFLVDAKGKILGRLAAKVASLLIGKHKPCFSRDKDMGDMVVVINAREIKVTGKKVLQKTYFRHSGFPGGSKQIPYVRMMEEKPCEIIIHAVKGMIPHNKLGKKSIKKLKVYPGPEHPHAAQNLEIFEL